MSRLVILLSRVQHLSSFESGSNPHFLRRQSSHQPPVSDRGLSEHEEGPRELQPCPSLQHCLKPTLLLHLSWSQGLCNMVKKWIQILQQINKKKDKDKKSQRKKLRTWPSPHFTPLWNPMKHPARFLVFSLDSTGIWVSKGKPSALFCKDCTRPMSTGLFLHSWLKLRKEYMSQGRIWAGGEDHRMNIIGREHVDSCN